MAKIEQKEVNIDQVVRYLTYTFDKATQKMGKAMRYKDPETKSIVKTLAYQYQVDFCYLINEIQMGPKCLIQKAISDCNELIERAAITQTLDSQN
jgi:hypothetical protein